VFVRVCERAVLKKFAYWLCKKAHRILPAAFALRSYPMSGQLGYEERKKGSTLGRPFSTVELLVEFDSAKFGLKKFRAD
jgi:hypothetical protein